MVGGYTMAFTLNNNDKFALVAIVDVYSKLPAQSEFQLSDGTWVLDRVPFDFGDPWRKWVGTTRFDILRDANVVLICRVPSGNPEILDTQHEELARPLLRMFHLLQLSGVLEYGGAHVLKGSVVSGSTQVRQMSELKTFRQTKGYTRVPVDMTRLQHASRLRAGLDQIEYSGNFKRVIRGLNVLMDGLQQPNGQERIHQFARSLEALILPAAGKTRRQFVHRCQTFAQAGPDAERILGEAFDMRSDTEHLNDWDGALTAYPLRDRENIALHRTRQMERLACVTYSRILDNESLRQEFQDEQKQATFWRLDDASRRTTWGTQFDLAAVPLVNDFDGWDRAVTD